MDGDDNLNQEVDNECRLCVQAGKYDKALPFTR